jgi:hypothetical protein
MQRAISGLCVAWKPEIAPQAIVMKRHGNIGSLAIKLSVPRMDVGWLRLLAARLSHNSGIAGCFMKSPTRSAAAMNSREKANSGYILPIILSIGRSVAIT